MRYNLDSQKKSNKGIVEWEGCMRQTRQKPNYGFNQEDLELAPGELKVALIFADYSSAAYSRGKLKHAIDARCKAKSLCMRVAARLTTEQKHFAAGG
jgi:hypothetical protein